MVRCSSQTTITIPINRMTNRELTALAICSEAPNSTPGKICAAAHATAEVTFMNVKCSGGNPDIPAITGTIARSGPRKRPRKTLFPPLVAK